MSAAAKVNKHPLRELKSRKRLGLDIDSENFQDNFSKALTSVQLSTIRKWEHRMVRWMTELGLDAQFRVIIF